MQNEQNWFEELLRLVGKDIEIGLKTNGSAVVGKVKNTMFDSFILDCKGQTKVVRFQDLSYLLPLQNGKA